MMYEHQTDHCPCCGWEYVGLVQLPGKCSECREDRVSLPKHCRYCGESH